MSDSQYYQGEIKPPFHTTFPLIHVDKNKMRKNVSNRTMEPLEISSPTKTSLTFKLRYVNLVKRCSTGKEITTKGRPIHSSNCFSPHKLEKPFYVFTLTFGSASSSYLWIDHFYSVRKT